MQSGQQLGPFTIEKQIGSGAMGVVYRAVYNKTGQRVAIKLMLPVADRKNAERFQREVEILKQLRHPNIVRLLFAGSHAGSPYYAMEYIQGESLDRALSRRGRLSWEEVVTLGRQLCSALEHAHEKGVVHRDLKPSNLMVLADGTLKLTDFGIAKDLDVTQLTETHCTVGTASYMSPEQCRGERNLTHKSDLYSLGIVLYELVTGKKPFVSDNVMDMFMMHVKGSFERPSRVVDVPKWLDVLICQLLEKKPEQRPRDAATVGEALNQVLEKVEARQSAGVEAARSRSAEAGDRETARSLLDGKKKKKKKEIVKVPLHQRTWPKAVGLLLALAGIGVAIWLAFRPPSAEQVSHHDAEAELRDNLATAYKRGLKTMQDLEKMDALNLASRRAVFATLAEDEGDLIEARKRWEELIEKHPHEGSWGRLAQRRIDDQLTAVPALLASTGQYLPTLKDRPEEPLNLPDETTGKALRAIRYEEVGDSFQALREWEEIKKDTAGDAARRTWYLLAASRARELSQAPPGTRDDETRKEIVWAYLDGGSGTLLEARYRAQTVVDLYGGDSRFEEIRLAAAEKIKKIDNQRGVAPK